MEKTAIIARLRQHEEELKAAGIAHLSLFGSVVRGEAGEESDIDLMADFDLAKRLSLLNVIGLENRLTEILGAKADLSQKRMMKPEVLEQAAREAVLVF